VTAGGARLSSRIVRLGGVPEWLNGAVSKTVVRALSHRGFESLPLRLMRLDLRVRLLGRLQRATGWSVATMTPRQLRRAQTERIPHNPLANALYGRPAPGVRWTDRTVPGREAPIAVRVYRPPGAGEPLPVVMHFHGGGWTIGTLDTADWACTHVARDARAVVVSVGYRLAPQHPYPAAVHDCFDATRWVAAHAEELGGRGDRLAVMGDSAGGNLAAVTCLLARDLDGPRILHQALVYPATDLTLGSPSIAEKPREPILSRADIDAFLAHYLSGGGDPASDPLLSPLLADHRGLPPALVQTAEHDPIRDDGLRYAEALRGAGVPVRYTEYLGQPHGWVSVPGACRAAPQALAEVGQELRAHLHAPASAAAPRVAVAAP
jgi:acetyl esterase/lipase